MNDKEREEAQTDAERFGKDHNVITMFILIFTSKAAPFTVGIALIEIFIKWTKGSPPHGGYLLVALFCFCCAAYMQMRYNMKWYEWNRF